MILQLVLKQTPQLGANIPPGYNVVTRVGYVLTRATAARTPRCASCLRSSPRRQRAQRSAASSIRPLHRFQFPWPVGSRSRLLAEAWPHEAQTGARARPMLVPLYRRSLSMLPTTSGAATEVLAWSRCRRAHCMRAAGWSLSPRPTSSSAPCLPCSCRRHSVSRHPSRPRQVRARQGRHAPVAT